MQQIERQRAERLLRGHCANAWPPGEGPKKPRSKSNMKWARHYLPHDFPEKIALRIFNRPPDRGNRVA
eukprot:5319604-Lingulodinium_polyedra.AAC.1